MKPENINSIHRQIDGLQNVATNEKLQVRLPLKNGKTLTVWVTGGIGAKERLKIAADSALSFHKIYKFGQDTLSAEWSHKKEGISLKRKLMDKGEEVILINSDYLNKIKSKSSEKWVVLSKLLGKTKAIATNRFGEIMAKTTPTKPASRGTQATAQLAKEAFARIPQMGTNEKKTHELTINGIPVQVNDYGKGAENPVDERVFEDRFDLLHQTADALGYSGEATCTFPKGTSHKEAESLMGDYIYQVTNELGIKIKDFQSKEKELVLKRGRPVVVNRFFIRGQQMLSMQIPGSVVTIPSSLRDRPGLANYVTTAFGVVDNKGEVSIKYQAIRHSIYPPIEIKNSIERQAYAMGNVRQLLTDCTKKALLSNPHIGDNQPITIPLRTMMLVTPWRGDFVRGYESESQQLEESVRALQLFAGRTIEVTIDGVHYKITPDIDIMNLGVNPAATFAPEIPLQKEINAMGFNHFVEEGEKHLEEVGRGFNFLRPTLNKIRSLSTNKKIEQLRAKIAEKKTPIEPQGKLESLYEKWMNEPDQRPMVEKEIKDVKNSLKIAQRRLYSLHRQLLGERRNLYKKNKNKLIKLERKLEESLTLGQVSFTKYLDFHQSFTTAKSAFYEENYRTKEGVMDFQTRYIELQSEMKNFIEFFCKSAEDRTGRLDDKVQEKKAFQILKDRFGDRADLLREVISEAIHQFSASQNNTWWNSNSRGMQIHPDVNPNIPAKLTRSGGHLAKGVFKAAKRARKNSV